MKHYTEKELADTWKLVESTIANCEKVQPKLKEGSPQLSLSKNRIRALYISRELLANGQAVCTTEELEQAVLQITSIKNKSMTGIDNAKEGSGTYTRFQKIITAMDVVLDYLQDALQNVGKMK